MDAEKSPGDCLQIGELAEHAVALYAEMKYDQGRAADTEIVDAKVSPAEYKIDALLRLGESFLAYRYLEQPDYLRARRAFAEVLAMADADADSRAQALLGIGDAFAAERQYAEAGAEYEKAAALEWIKPELEVEAQYRIGSNERAQGKFERARDAYAKILRMPEAGGEYKEMVEQRIRAVYW